VRRVIDDIAQDAAPLGFLKNPCVDFARGGGHDHEKHIIQIGELKAPLRPANFAGLRVPFDRTGGARGYYVNCRACFNQPGKLGFGHRARSHDEAGAALEFHENWEETHV